ncbi:MAG: autotransporter domain-containing protein [Pseudorhodoplanes sp.]
MVVDVVRPALAQDATWSATPGSDDITAGANWVGGVTPTGIGSFGASNTTNLTMGANATFGGLTTLLGSPDYTINIMPAGSRLLIIDGAGVTVNGGALNLVVGHELRFNNNATAGAANITNNVNGSTSFNNNSSAGSSTFTNNWVLFFNDTSIAGSAAITNNFLLRFNDTSTGGTAAITNGAAGNLDISFHGGPGVSIGSLAGAGTVTLGNKMLTVGGNNTSTAFSGDITGVAGQLQKEGNGTLTLSNVSTYTGATTVNAGTLAVNGDITASSGVTVNNGGVLGGTGTVGGTTVNAGGTLAPGNSIGTVTVNGGLTFNAGANYNVEVSPTDADRTNVIGAATLAGGVNATYQAGTYTAKQYTILNATGGITGTFDTLANTNKPSNVSAALSYDANNVYLNLALSYVPAVGGLNTNQQSVATALTNYFNTTGGIPTVFTNLSPNDLSQISGQPAATMALSLTDNASLFTHTVFQYAFGNFGAGAGGSAIGYAPQSRVSREATEAFAALPVKAGPAGPATSFAERWSVWAAAYGGNSRVSGDNIVGTNTTTSRAFGMVAGASYKVAPGALIGFAIGGAGTSFAIANGFGSGKADVFHAALYGRHEIGKAYVAGLLGYAWQDAETDRTVTVAGTDVLHASYRPHAFSGRAEAGYRLAMPAVDAAPYGAVQVTSLRLPAYGETATSGSNQFALSYASRTATTVRTELGLRLESAYAVGDGAVTLRGRAAWAHDWRSGQGATSILQTLPGATFIVDGAEPDADSALISTGIGYAFARGWSVAADFDGEFSDNTNSYAGRAQLRRSW